MAMTNRASKGTVYVARITSGFYAGAIKVGFTSNLGRRMRQLHAEVIASAPGSFIQEQYLVRQCDREHRMLPHWREWFREDALVTLAPAWERMFGTDLPTGEAVS